MSRGLGDVYKRQALATVAKTPGPGAIANSSIAPARANIEASVIVNPPQKRRR